MTMIACFNHHFHHRFVGCHFYVIVTSAPSTGRPSGPLAFLDFLSACKHVSPKRRTNRETGAAAADEVIYL